MTQLAEMASGFIADVPLSAIRTDNGVPFAKVSLARLSTLSAWWVAAQIESQKATSTISLMRPQVR